MLGYNFYIYKELVSVNLQKTLESFSGIKRWAYVLHDKEVDFAHYHVYLEFDSDSVHHSFIAFCEIHKLKVSFEDWIFYAMHDRSTMYWCLYSFDDIVSNFDIQLKLTNKK